MSGTILFNRPVVLPTTSYTISNLYITGGNVGINITSPTTSLDVSGSIRVSGGLAATFNSNTLGTLFTTGGNIGIATTSPSYNLDINGTMRINQMSGYVFTIGDTTSTSSTSLLIQTSSGNIEMGIASVNGGYSSSALIGDAVIRGASNRSLFLQSGFGSSSICLRTNGNIGIVTASDRTRLSITPNSVEPKITLWDGGVTSTHYGFGISSNQFNYHVDATFSNHVFSATGRNGDGIELVRFTGTGLIQAPNFKAIQVFAISQTAWGGVSGVAGGTGTNSSNFTVGSGTKMLYASYCYYSPSTGNSNVYFDIYTSTNTLVTTLTTYLHFNVAGIHMPTTYSAIISNATMPEGTYYIKARTDGMTNPDEYLYAVLLNFPF